MRDGGYYNNWDFNEDILSHYLRCMERLPVDILEIGYRSFPQKEYFGKLFYTPLFILKKIRSFVPSKKIAIMLNERDNSPKRMSELLSDCREYVDIVRIAVDPTRLSSAIQLAESLKELGFQVGFNLMYMSEIVKNPEILTDLQQLNGKVDYFSLVDSFGGVFPTDVISIVKEIKKILTMPIGFHGHNNIEMSLANSLAAIDAGCTIIDSTITGMGRGAGNLKTELLLTVLNSKNTSFELDFNALSEVVNVFLALQDKYRWGTNLPYMVSGANSLPQKDVMNWVGKNRYSIDSIITALKNKKDKNLDNVKLPLFSYPSQLKKAVIIGGGISGIDNSDSIIEYINKNSDICIIHSSTRNAKLYENVNVPQFYCLVGNEGYRLESVFNDLHHLEHLCILPPYPRKMGTYIPKSIETKSYELKEINFIDKFHDSPLTLAIQTAIDLGVSDVEFVGFDGYGDSMNSSLYELSMENQIVFDNIYNTFKQVEFLTPTLYKNIPLNSIFSYLI